MTNLKSLSDELRKKYANGTAKRPLKPFREGFEVEQSAFNDEGGHRCSPIVICPNQEGIPGNIPYSVMARSIILGDGHWDGSLPWEFNLHHSVKENCLLETFIRIVKKEPWVWHKEFNVGGSVHGCSAHYHVSVVGDIDLGPSFGNQSIAPLSDWAITWNNYVTLMMLMPAFFCHGRRFRESGLSQWAKPVYDRFEENNVCDIFERGQTTVRSGKVYTSGHEYSALSWNRHSKPQVTIENRLNETHPFFSIPVIKLFSAINSACVARGDSVKMFSNGSGIAERYWRFVMQNDVYASMLKMTNIEFVRNIPFLEIEETYPTALDLFRSITRRFINVKMNLPIDFGKVMRLWGDFIDFTKIPAYLLWDINKLHYLLYESKERKKYQDQFLYFGSSVVDCEQKWVSNAI